MDKTKATLVLVMFFTLLGNRFEIFNLTDSKENILRDVGGMKV